MSNINIGKKEIVHFIGLGRNRYEWSSSNNANYEI